MDDALKPLQQALDAAVRIAAELAVDDALVAEHSRYLAAAGEGRRYGYTASVLHAAVIEIAECHDDVCDDVDCCLCRHLRDALAIVTASLRVELADELDRRFDFGPAVRRRTQRVERPPHTPEV